MRLLQEATFVVQKIANVLLTHEAKNTFDAVTKPPAPKKSPLAPHTNPNNGRATHMFTFFQIFRRVQAGGYSRC
jgi:hypothetical protein